MECYLYRIIQMNEYLPLNYIDYSRMLTQEVADDLSLNRKCQKAPVFDSEIAAKIPIGLYQNLICWLLTYCDSIQIASTTKFLAKTYIEAFIKKAQVVIKEKLQLLSVCSVWIAVKFNEMRDFSDKFTITIANAHAGGNWSNEEIRQMEMDILASINFKLSYTTPYDYIRPFFQCFPWLTKLKKVLPMIIDFAITIPSSASYTAEELFFGCFVAVIRMKKWVLTELQEKVLMAFIPNQETPLVISAFIECYYGSVMECEFNDDASVAEKKDKELLIQI